jgi:hypothetical protein
MLNPNWNRINLRTLLCSIHSKPGETKHAYNIRFGEYALLSPDLENVKADIYIKSLPDEIYVQYT